VFGHHLDDGGAKSATSYRVAADLLADRPRRIVKAAPLTRLAACVDKFRYSRRSPPFSSDEPTPSSTVLPFLLASAAYFQFSQRLSPSTTTPVLVTTTTSRHPDDLKAAIAGVQLCREIGNSAPLSELFAGIVV
jgi:hypothetical protein